MRRLCTPQGALPRSKGASLLEEETPAALHDLLSAFATPATGAASDDDDDTPRGDAQNTEFQGWSSPEEVRGAQPSARRRN
jgi:hypothetical protein